jgi:hypothetical protein
MADPSALHPPSVGTGQSLAKQNLLLFSPFFYRGNEKGKEIVLFQNQKTLNKTKQRGDN